MVFSLEISKYVAENTFKRVYALILGALFAGFALFMPHFCLAFDAQLVNIPAGAFTQGSDEKERNYAYALDEAAYGHFVTREQAWYARELQKSRVYVGGFSIMKYPVTQAQYADFIRETGRAAPFVDEKTWQVYGLIHPYKRAQPYFWKGVSAPRGLEDHPVVAVSYEDAQAFARWVSDKTNQRWRLPQEAEWEKAARGTDARYFPWGSGFDAAFLNSHDGGPFRTVPVGSFPAGDSPYGVSDMAGQVFEWVDAPDASKRAFVKGGSWDDQGCGICRAAARHARPKDIRHILIGFRLVRENS